jgi:hypothetical protein
MAPEAAVAQVTADGLTWAVGTQLFAIAVSLALGVLGFITAHMARRDARATKATVASLEHTVNSGADALAKAARATTAEAVDAERVRSETVAAEAARKIDELQAEVRAVLNRSPAVPE